MILGHGICIWILRLALVKEEGKVDFDVYRFLEVLLSDVRRVLGLLLSFQLLLFPTNSNARMPSIMARFNFISIKKYHLVVSVVKLKDTHAHSTTP